MTFVSEYWKAPFTGLLRFIAMVVIFIFLGLALNHQRTRIKNPEYTPPDCRNDSVILLPAACFLDSQFKDLYSNISTSVREMIGYPMKPDQFWEFPLWIVTLIELAAGLLRTVMQWRNDRSGKAETYSYWKRLVISGYKTVVLILFLIVNIVA